MQITGGASRGQMVTLLFSAKNLSQGATDADMLTTVTDVAIYGYTAPWRGRIAAIAYDLHGAISAGTVSMRATFNNVGDSDTILTATAGATRSYYRVPRWRTKFEPGTLIGVHYTTSGDFSGNSTDILVSLYVVYDIGEI
jgi:hypothetical protein